MFRRPPVGQRLMEKPGLRNAAEITAYAVTLGLYDPT